MALGAFDGFDHYNGADILSRSGFLQWSSWGGSFVTGRNGYGKGLQMPGVATLIGSFAQRVATAGVGNAWYMPANSVTQASLVDSTVGGGTPQIETIFDGTNYTIQVWRGNNATGTLLYMSPNNVWTGNVWNYVEIWATIDPSVGTVQIVINGQVVVNLTGQNTARTSNNWWDNYFLEGGVGLIEDDFYYADGSTGPGSFPCNSPLGDMRVFTLFPIGSSGSTTWTPSPNTNQNWQNIDEIAMDSDTTYNFTDTAGNEELFNFQALANTVNKIVGVQITGAYRKDDATTHTLKQAFKSGATKDYGVTRSLPDTVYSYFTDLYVLDPNTTASWTLTAVNNIAGGYNLVT